MEGRPMFSQRSGSHLRLNRNQRGFTMLELYVVIALIVGVPCAILPPLHQIRLQTNQDEAKTDLLKLSAAANSFFSENGKVPESFEELAEFCERHPSLCDLDLILSKHIKNGYLFHISSPDSFTFIGEAEPYSGITGSETMFVDLNGNISNIPTPGSKKNQDILFDRINGRAAEKIAGLLALDPGSVDEIRESGFPVSISEISRMFDSNGDAMLSTSEIFDFKIGNDLEDELDAFLQFAKSEFQPGLYNENMNLQFIPLVEGGDPTGLFFNYDTLLRLTHLFVTNSSTARSMAAELKRAAKFARDGEHVLEAEAARAYLLLLEEATHQSVARQHALSLSFILRITTHNPIP
jgi:type II secretory pathway pseudopilin PulG